MATKEARALPTAEQLALADYKLSSARSDLDAFVTAVESQREDITMEAALAQIRSGEPFPDTEPLDKDELARIVVFATDVLTDAPAIEEYARKLLEVKMALIHENDGAHSDPEGFARYRQAVREWHERESADDGKATA